MSTREAYCHYLAIPEVAAKIGRHHTSSPAVFLLGASDDGAHEYDDGYCVPPVTSTFLGGCNALLQHLSHYFPADHAKTMSPAAVLTYFHDMQFVVWVLFRGLWWPPCHLHLSAYYIRCYVFQSWSHLLFPKCMQQVYQLLDHIVPLMLFYLFTLCLWLLAVPKGA